MAKQQLGPKTMLHQQLGHQQLTMVNPLGKPINLQDSDGKTLPTTEIKKRTHALICTRDCPQARYVRQENGDFAGKPNGKRTYTQDVAMLVP